MKDYLEHYEGKIYALSPIYVGSGEKIKKNAYIYAPRNHRVVIPDIENVYCTAEKRTGTGIYKLSYEQRRQRSVVGAMAGKPWNQ